MQTFQPFLQHSGVVVGQLQYFWHITKPIPCLDQSVITAVHLVVSYLVIPSWILSAMKALQDIIPVPFGVLLHQFPEWSEVWLSSSLMATL